MSHEIETMAYSNAEPWHGLGFRVPAGSSVKAMLKAAKLNWTVERREMMFEARADEDLETVPGFAALVRNSDNKVLDVVGSAYRPVQNEEAFSFFKEFVESGGATMETAGSLRGGKYVWGLASLNQSFTLRNNDKINGYLLVGSPHEQGRSLIIKFTTIRVVCNNTLTLALRKGGREWRMSHRLEFNDASMAAAKEALGIAHDQMGEFEKNARKLQKLKVTDKDAIGLFTGLFDPSSDEAPALDDALPRVRILMDVYKNAPGADSGNGFGVLNAVTYWADHIASRSADKRLSNAWLGRTAVKKEQMLNTLLDMAG